MDEQFKMLVIIEALMIIGVFIIGLLYKIINNYIQKHTVNKVIQEFVQRIKNNKKGE